MRSTLLRQARSALGAVILVAATTTAGASECSEAPDSWNARYQAAVKRVVAAIGNQPAYCAAKREQFAVGRDWLAWHLGHPRCGLPNPPKWVEARGRLERLQARVAGEIAEECR